MNHDKVIKNLTHKYRELGRQVGHAREWAHSAVDSRPKGAAEAIDELISLTAKQETLDHILKALADETARETVAEEAAHEVRMFVRGRHWAQSSRAYVIDAESRVEVWQALLDELRYA